MTRKKTEQLEEVTDEQLEREGYVSLENYLIASIQKSNLEWRLKRIWVLRLEGKTLSQVSKFMNLSVYQVMMVFNEACKKCGADKEKDLKKKVARLLIANNA